MLSLEHLVRLL
jgi:hypothetical protein